MKTLSIFTATCLVALLLPVPPSSAQDEKAVPLLTATIKSYDAFSDMVSTVAKAGDPAGKEDPLAELNALLADDPDAFDRTAPIHVAVWLNGMFEPLVAAYLPTDDFAGLKKAITKQGGGDNVEFEKLDGYALLLSGAKVSLEENLAAARAIDPSEIEATQTAEFTVRFDDPTRKMLKGVLAMGRLQMMQQGEELGDEATAEMMKAALAMYFDMFEGFIDGMEESTFTLGIVDKGIRFGLRSTAQDGSTFAKLIAKSPMKPAPIAKNYVGDAAFSVSGRVSEIDDDFLGMIEEIAVLGAKFSGVEDGESFKKSMGLMRKMAPMYYSLGYDFDEELTATGRYEFGEDKDVAALYDDFVKVGVETGKLMSGKGKMYRDFNHEHATLKGGTEVDRFRYRMGDDFPPNPLMGDKMEMEYAHLGRQILFTMGGKGIASMLKRREPSAIPAFLKPNETTVMIGHLDILSLIGTFAQVEVAHPSGPTVFIADGDVKGAQKNKGAAKAAGSKILMRASLDDALNFDLHIPLSLIRTLARLN